MTYPDQNKQAPDDSSDDTPVSKEEKENTRGATSPMGILIPPKGRTSPTPPKSSARSLSERLSKLTKNTPPPQSNTKKDKEKDKNKAPKSTLLMFDRREKEEDTEDATEMIDIEELKAQHESDASDLDEPELEEESGDKTEMLSLEELQAEQPDDFHSEKTELAPGLADAHPPDSSPAEPDIHEIPPDTDPSIQPAPALRTDHSLLTPSTNQVFARTPETPPPRQDVPSLAHQAPEDFEVEKTELFQSPFDNDPICSRLTTLSGPCVGQEFLINRMRNSVGRASKNSVAIADLSMSRKHFEIIQKPDESYTVRDMQAVNGTELNGVKILESDLFHGDRITAGESVFQFLIPGDIPVDHQQRRLIPAASTQTASGNLTNPNPQSSTRQHGGAPRHKADRVLLIVIIVAALLCVPLSAYLFLTLMDKEDVSTVQAAPTSEYYFQAATALRNRDWDEAQSLFEKSYQIDPEFGDVQEQFARIERERRSSQAVERARALAGDEIDDQLLQELRLISSESAYHSDAQSLLRVAGHDEDYALLSLAQREFDEGNLETSTSALQELLDTSPRHEGAQQLLRIIEDTRTDQEGQREESERQAAAERAQNAAPARPTPRRPAPRPSPSPSDDDLNDPFAQPRSVGSSGSRSGGSGVVNFTEGFSLYRSEDFNEAISHFDAIAQTSSGSIATRSRDAAQDIRQFRDALQSGRRALSDGNFESARNHFQSAVRADESVAGGTGYFDDTTSELLATSFARQGLQEVESDNFSRAFSLLTDAQQHHPRESTTRQLARALEDKANSLYIQAANHKKSDPQRAASLCHTILTMVPSSSDTHRRTREMLDEID